MWVSESPWIAKRLAKPLRRWSLVCFAHAGAGAGVFHGWQQALPDSIDLIAIRLPGRESRLGDTPIERFPELVAALLSEVTPWLEPPFALFGHSLGALIAAELTAALALRGGSLPAHLILSGQPAPQLARDREQRDRPLAERIALYGGHSAALLEDAELYRMMEPVLRADFALLDSFAARTDMKLDVPLTLVHAVDDRTVPRADLAAWSEVGTAQVHIVDVPGDHYYLRDYATETRSALVAALEGSSQR